MQLSVEPSGSSLVRCGIDAVNQLSGACLDVGEYHAMPAFVAVWWKLAVDQEAAVRRVVRATSVHLSGGSGPGQTRSAQLSDT
jgi:hypothetical protein